MDIKTRRARTHLLLVGGLSTFLLLMPGIAGAVPTLQVGLDADNVWYESDPLEESVMTDSGNFSVCALLTPKVGASPAAIEELLGQTYYLSIAITPAIEGPYDPSLALGSFTIDGQEIQVVGDMVYGTPPIENADLNQPKDAGDLPQHGIFPTYYLEVAFRFDPEKTTPTYNVQDDPDGFMGMVEDGGTYCVMFDIESGGLDGEYGLHFDLYSEQGMAGDIDADLKAPFSHDAGTTSVPEPGTLWLLGMGAAGLFWVRKRA